MSNPKKAAPREKEVAFSPVPYRVLETSFINGSLHVAGTEPVYLPEGTTAGANLERVDGKDERSDEGNEFLDRTIPEIVEDLEACTDDDLAEHLEAEQDGKARKGVIDAIEKEIEARNA
ncbi:hypothetical protein ACQKIE_16065 [Luteibacter sp. NPDC031894]|uniref:hypothetical protein n=1 Tax=Luteibacter sp. NPDC031894 TaxID=3390572 RepID=UPI003D065FDF